MKFNDFRVLAFTFAVAATSGLAQAGQISFDDTNCRAGSASAIACSTSSAGANYGATVTGWSASSTGTFSSASLAYYSGGVGITSSNEYPFSPDHAIDNNGNTEALLINFGANFALNQLSIGWYSGDADVSILRYTGTEAPTLGSRTIANLTSATGWELVGDYATLSINNTLNFNNGDDAKTASWWLVSAYNSAYSGSAPAWNSGLGNGNDYFKLSGFGGTVVAQTPTTPTQPTQPTPPAPGTAVPEPGSFALFGIAMLGFVAVRRKSKTM